MFFVEPNRLISNRKRSRRGSHGFFPPNELIVLLMLVSFVACADIGEECVLCSIILDQDQDDIETNESAFGDDQFQDKLLFPLHLTGSLPEPETAHHEIDHPDSWLRENESLPEPVAPLADRVIAWTHHGIEPTVVARLAYSISTAARQSQGKGISCLLVYHNMNVSCTDDGAVQWPWEFAMDTPIRMLLSGIKCETLHMPPESKRRLSYPCMLERQKLISDVLYLLPMSDTGVDESGIDQILQSITSHGRGGRKDLVENGRGNNYRFILDKVVLSLGIKKLLYLDSDTVMVRDPTPLFDSNDTMPLVVAISNHTAYGRLTCAHEWRATDMSRTKKWGFVNPAKQCFNAGVMMMNVQLFCRLQVFSKMLAVSKEHQRKSLFGQAGNQPIVETAAARHVHFVSFIWNCRHEKQPELCSILHFKFFLDKDANASSADPNIKKKRKHSALNHTKPSIILPWEANGG